MRKIRSIDTKPELLLRRELWARGIRYRLRRRILGTRPDLVFLGAKLAVFVDGCFWHGCPTHYKPPVGNGGYWRDKIAGNCARDLRNNEVLQSNGWQVIRLWECDVKASPSKAAEAIVEMLRPQSVVVAHPSK